MIKFFNHRCYIFAMNTTQKPKMKPIMTTRFNKRTTRPIASLTTAIFLTATLSLATHAASFIFSEHAAGAGGGAYFPGNSFTTPSGGPWDHISFSWLVGSAPRAFGSLFLFSEPYLGSPQVLITGVPPPSLMAESVSTAGGVYSFAPRVTLQPGTEYFVYADAVGTVSFGPANPGEGGYAAWVQSGVNARYDATGLIHGYRLSGELTAVPEPSSVFSAIAMILASAFVLRRRTGA